MHAGRRAEPKREAQAGFAIGTYDQGLIEDNARDRADSRYGDPEWRDEMVHLGVLTRDGTITDKGWALLNRDMEHLEGNALAWMHATFNSAQDHGHGGHGGEELVGNFWFDPTNYDQAWLVELASDSPGRSERIDMTDASFGDLANTAFNEVSAFGSAVLGGQINFFDVQPEDWETIEDTVARGARGARRRGVGTEEAPRRAAGRYYEIKKSRLGWAATLFDSKGRSVNVINGGPDDSETTVRQAAQRHWPGIPERRRAAEGVAQRRPLPDHLHAAWNWIDSAGEWEEALKSPKSYARAAYKNAVQHGTTDVTVSDLIEVIEWAAEERAPVGPTRRRR
jgi:hypothetical protein